MDYFPRQIVATLALAPQNRSFGLTLKQLQALE